MNNGSIRVQSHVSGSVVDGSVNQTAFAEKEVFYSNSNGNFHGTIGELRNNQAEDQTSSSNVETGVAPRQRRRSQSVATTHPSVETVVVKAKRAASILWTLLHAQNCTIAQGCRHSGCKEAKKLHLHLKTCPAAVGPGHTHASCPSGYNGCDQARKLLSHYRRCRSMRARQQQRQCVVGGTTGGWSPASEGSSTSSSTVEEPQHCLICSLVARQARSLLLENRTINSQAQSKSTPSLFSHHHQWSYKPKQRVVTSFMLDRDNRIMPPPGGMAIVPTNGRTCVRPSGTVDDANDVSQGSARRERSHSVGNADGRVLPLSFRCPAPPGEFPVPEVRQGRTRSASLDLETVSTTGRKLLQQQRAFIPSSLSNLSIPEEEVEDDQHHPTQEQHLTGIVRGSRSLDWDYHPHNNR